MKLTTKAALLALCTTPAFAEAPEIQVTAVTETAPIKGDADDPAIWVHPNDPEQSLVLGTDKTKGLYVFNLKGEDIALFEDGALNNVDIRPFTLNGEAVWIASAAERNAEDLVFYVIHADGTIEHATPFAFPAAAGEMVDALDEIYGSALQINPETGQLYAWVNYKSGHAVQFEVTETDGTLELTYQRTLKVGSQPEGMVADEAGGHFYIGEEDVAIWRFPAFAEGGNEATKIVGIPSECFPKDDIEGLSIYDGADQRYLVASAQGIHRAAIFPLNGEDIPTCAGLVEIAAGDVDGVSETDGLDVVASPLGADFPQGMLVMMDDQNEGFSTNFKLISWADIAAKLDLK